MPPAPPAGGAGGTTGGSGPLHELIDDNFLQFASYTICNRAIPTVEDGLKPVQRRIMHALWEADDGRFTKVAGIVGDTMHYHPHGDASIYEAIVNLVNMRYLVEGQGNYGNLFTGDPAAAPRYIECRLTELARKEGQGAAAIAAEEQGSHPGTIRRGPRGQCDFPRGRCGFCTCILFADMRL